MTYEPDRVTACRIVLLDVLRLLEPWRDHLMLIGGWAVRLQLESVHRAEAQDYVGTMDVDIDGDIGAAQAHAIRGRLIEAGYRQDERMSGRLVRTVEINGVGYEVPVDLMLGSSTQRHGRAQRALMLDVEGTGPDGTAVRRSARVVSVPDLLVMKLRPYADNDAKMKDGYDIYQLLHYAADTPEQLAAEVAAGLSQELRAELARNMRIFFLQTRRAARDAAIMMREFNAVPRKDALADAMGLARRFLDALEG